jgi:hypothetical protein
MPSPNLPQISRSDLYRAFKDDGLVRLFEQILQTLNETLPADTTVVQAAIDAHIADTTDAHQGSAIGVTPTGGIASNNVQAALAELDSEKLAASLVTAYGLTLIAAANAVAARTVLALGTIATQNANAVSLSGGTIGLASGTLGYATGNGGTVTQTLNKGTGVTLNKITGEITLNAAGLAANSAVTFTLTNSTIAAQDRVVVNHISGGTFTAYALDAQPGTGSALIGVRNLTAGSLSEAIVIGFTVIKAANS